ncbi:MAG: GtrA family protein [Bacilli bacterium]|nr:GtrA family protein [Bacilli bacterium]
MENVDKNQENVGKTPVNEVPAATRNIKIECLLSAAAIAVGMVIAIIIGLLVPANKETFEIAYGGGDPLIREKGTLIVSLINGFAVNLATLTAFYFIRPSGIKPVLGEKCRNLILLIILSLFGVLAHVVLGILVPVVSIPQFLIQAAIAIIVGVYDLFIYKLYMENRTYSNSLFWEIFRFGIVGLVAAVFDFLTVFAFRFGVFGSGTEWYVTLVATTCGFIVGVTINYLMSTYMVYKASKSNLAKTAKGVVFFVVLSAIGLGIGIGLEYLLYDLFFLSLGIAIFIYPVVFVVRTLVVMVYNYLSRKLLIYK